MAITDKREAKMNISNTYVASTRGEDHGSAARALALSPHWFSLDNTHTTGEGRRMMMGRGEGAGRVLD